MFLLRLAALLFLVAYSFSMGQTPPSGLNAFGKFISGMFFLLAPVLYFLPSLEAWLNKHSNLAAVGLLNIFLGWTFIGWVAAYIWAFKKPSPVTIEGAPSTAPMPSAAPTRAVKQCPFCAEEVLAAAIKCKHCGSVLA